MTFDQWCLKTNKFMLIESRGGEARLIPTKSEMWNSVRCNTSYYYATKGAVMAVEDCAITLDGTLYFTSKLSGNRYSTSMENVRLFIKP